MSDKCPKCGIPLGTGEHAGELCLHCRPKPKVMVDAKEISDLRRKLEQAKAENERLKAALRGAHSMSQLRRLKVQMGLDLNEAEKEQR